MPSHLNVADRLAPVAKLHPDVVAVACLQHDHLGNSARARRPSGIEYTTLTFGQLEAAVSACARGLLELGVTPGMRLVLLVPAGVDFVALVFALLRCGAVTVLVDPGLGRRHLLNCLAAVKPDGFLAVPQAQAIRALLRHRFPQAKFNLTLGRRWFWGGSTLQEVQQLGSSSQTELPATGGSDAAAIIFTSGSTGPPKGVLYTHRMFVTQVDEIQSRYALEPGGVDLACFPLFGLFNAAMGVTTVLPDMDFSRPAAASPAKLVAAANDWHVTQSFASPAVWDRLSRYCQQRRERIDTLTRIFSCGAPVPAELLARTLACAAPEARMHTPYGATECLPVSTIEAAEVLGETAAQTRRGAGICVGTQFPSIHWRVIRISDEPISKFEDVEQLPVGEIGELIVQGPQASPRYVTSLAANAMSKIPDGNAFWHRMGDVGYMDTSQRFWYCGRQAHRVVTPHETLFTVPIEALFNTHPAVRRSALVGLGPRGAQVPAIVVEAADGSRPATLPHQLQQTGQSHHQAQQIHHFLVKASLPVDVRHNAKINRESLAEWASKRIRYDRR